jgi:tetratricopeptide (TPR) repeat protein
MHRFLIITLLILSNSFYGQTKDQYKAIKDKTKVKQVEIIKEEKIEAVIKKYDALIELNTKNDTAYYKRAKAKVSLIRYVHLYPPTALLKDIINDYTEVIKLKSRYSAEAYYGRANAKRSCRITDNYIEDLEKAVDINPKYSQAWYDMGMYYYQAGGDRMTINERDNRKSIECFTKVIEINDTLYNRHGAYIFRAGGRVILKDYKGAIEDYTKAIGLNKNDSLNYSNYFRRAWLRDELKDYKGAIEDYTKVIEAQSNNKYFRPGQYLLLRGNIKLKAGDTEGACLDWNVAEKEFRHAKNFMGINDSISKYCK